MRRRNAKTVQFAAPTYVEASDYEFSEDEAEADIPADASQAETDRIEAVQTNGSQGTDTSDAEAGLTSDEQSSPKSATKNAHYRNSFDREQAASAAHSLSESLNAPKLLDKSEAAPLKSKRVTNRSDTFLKDESPETRKISLTPGILKDDGASVKSTSSDSARKDSVDSVVVKAQASADSLKKEAKKEKDKEKEKEKKRRRRRRRRSQACSAAYSRAARGRSKRLH